MANPITFSSCAHLLYRPTNSPITISIPTLLRTNAARFASMRGMHADVMLAPHA
jgi:hypothetical protein